VLEKKAPRQRTRPAQVRGDSFSPASRRTVRPRAPDPERNSSREAASADTERMMENRIEACERQPYHLSACIQPHGVFCAIDPATFKIVRISANAGTFLGRAAEDALGVDLREFLCPETADRLVSFADIGFETRKSLILTFDTQPAFPADTFLYRSGPLLCLEFEESRVAALEMEAASQQFFDLIERLSQGPTSSGLPSIVCEAIREVTGMDRVYYCRFDIHGHGHVLGESRNDVLPALLDHHFPATDVPTAVRRMFLLNPFRMIPDTDAGPVPVLGGGGEPLDLTMSTCRAVADTHLQYNRNMGVKATFSLPVVKDGRVEAIFGGHHAAARLLSFRQMAICRHLSELFKSRFETLKAREERVLLAGRAEALYMLSGSFEAAGHDLGDFVAANHGAFAMLMDADDVLCMYKGQKYLGHLLSKHEAERLLDYLKMKLVTGPNFYQTECLGEEDASFVSLCPAVAGVCAVSLDLLGNSIIVWLRREVVTVQKWSGDPGAHVVSAETGSVGPRTSFLAYMREVKGRCPLWPPVSEDLSHQLRHVFAQVLANHYEIGMRKAAEESNAIKSEFVANVSHELRSPMHAIIGFADLLGNAGDMPTDKRQRAANVIKDSARRLLRLINDLLDLSKLEAGKMTFAFSDGDIVHTMDLALRDVASLARAKAIEIEVRDERQTKQARFDSARTAQVIINLLSNAIKFSPRGGRIGIRLATPNAGGLAVQVTDEGPGIPGGELDMIFGKFMQSSRTKSGAGGTGLGLAICRDIIHAHRGRIWAENNAERGASFFFEIPLLTEPQRETS
jgi:two-component system, chemotaxis family, sensor kinase Cph1